MLRAALILAFVGGVAVVSAQTLTVSPLAFDAVSIKRNISSESGGSHGVRPGGWQMTNGIIATVIRAAYPAQSPDLIGAPSWVMNDSYDIIAKATDNPSRDDITTMLRALLAERFSLAVHYERHERPVYAVVVARSDGRLGPGLRRSNIDCDAVNTARREGRTPEGPMPANGAPPCAWSAQFSAAATLRFGGLPLSRLSDALGRPDGRVIIDKTGLPGHYEFELRYSPSPTNGDAEPPLLFTALEEQLGLKLVADRALLDVLVIDSVERPTPD